MAAIADGRFYTAAGGMDVSAPVSMIVQNRYYDGM
jgi:hypothetical protein